MTTLAFILIAGTSDPTLLQTLQGYARQDVADFEAIVILDAPSKEAREVAAAWTDERFTFILNPRLQGLARTWNAAWERMGDASLVVLACGDHSVGPGFLTDCGKVLDKHPEHGAVYPSYEGGDACPPWLMCMTRKCAVEVGPLSTAYGSGGVGMMGDWHARCRAMGYSPSILRFTFATPDGFSVQSVTADRVGGIEELEGPGGFLYQSFPSMGFVDANGEPCGPNDDIIPPGGAEQHRAIVAGIMAAPPAAGKEACDVVFHAICAGAVLAKRLPRPCMMEGPLDFLYYLQATMRSDIVMHGSLYNTPDEPWDVWCWLEAVWEEVARLDLAPLPVLHAVLVDGLCAAEGLVKRWEVAVPATVMVASQVAATRRSIARLACLAVEADP